MSEFTMRFRVDGQEVLAKSGDTILKAALRAGVYVPHLCAHRDLSPWGSCRLCIVLVNGRCQPSCIIPVADDMIVENDTAELNSMRRDLLAMLFVEGNHYCAFCERGGTCELQALAYRLGLLSPRYPYLYPVRPVDASHPDIEIDHNRCIQCARCVRASKEIDGKNVYSFAGRGKDKHLIVNSSRGLGGTNAAITDKATEVCPVASIIRKHETYRVRYGLRKWDMQPIGTDIDARRGQSQG